MGVFCTSPALCLLACSLVTDTSGLAGEASPDDGGVDTPLAERERMDWLDPAWGARRAIVVPAARLIGEVRDFPVYVDLASLDGAVKARADEVRLTKRALDDAWLRAEFESQSSPSTFATVQGEELR